MEVARPHATISSLHIINFKQLDNLKHNKMYIFLTILCDSWMDLIQKATTPRALLSELNNP